MKYRDLDLEFAEIKLVLEYELTDYPRAVVLDVFVAEQILASDIYSGTDSSGNPKYTSKINSVERKTFLIGITVADKTLFGSKV